MLDRQLEGRRIDALTDDERRLLPDGTRAEEHVGVYVSEYVLVGGRWRRIVRDGSLLVGVPWLARITHLPVVK